MEGLSFYYLVEFTPDVNQKLLGIDLKKDFPSLKQVISGSDDFHTYQGCTEHAVRFLQEKVELLNEGEQRYKIYFEKNQFDSTGDWEENEVVKIYVADSLQTVYNSLFKARVFFIKPVDLNSYFEAPKTLQ